MKVNYTWIEKNFNEFNEKYFNGALPTPHFEVCNTKSFLGQASYKGRTSGNLSYKIKISNFYDRKEKEFQNTLIHEMIHLYFYDAKKYSVHHGKEFQSMARSFDKYGWDIRTSDSSEKHTTNHIIPKRIIVKFEDATNGKVWLCAVADNKAKINNIVDFLMRNGNHYLNVEWFTTTSDKFVSLKTCHKRLGGKVVTLNDYANDYLPHLTPTKM